MSSEKQTALTIRILGRDYAIACPEDERESLLRSAEYLSRRMHSIQRKGKTLGIDRIAVMAALNIARDLIDAERRLEQVDSGVPASKPDTDPAADERINDRLSQLQLRIESALDERG